jgi:hypothetical protein
VHISHRSVFAALLIQLSAAALGTLHAAAAENPPRPPRPMSTDRPDTTESPYTVPTGMFQIEASFFDFSRDRRGTSTRSKQWVFGQVNLKRGLASDTDLQIIVNSYSMTTQEEDGDRTHSNGFGDVTLRLKQNLWGNDSGTTAMALMPYLTIPTHTSVSANRWAGGLILPLAVTLPNGWSLGIMSQFDFIERYESDSNEFQWLQSVTTGIPVTERISTYFEMVSIANPKAPVQLSSNAGINFQVTDELVFDVGCRIGINRAAPDLGVFSGFSIRF